MAHPSATHIAVLQILASGGRHSGEAIASRLGLSRTAIWKALGKLRHELDLPIAAIRGHGYQLESPLELLDAAKIYSALPPHARLQVDEIEVHASLESTNEHLLRLARSGAPSGRVCLAEHQCHGRGRRGRTWVSPFGRSILLSLLRRFSCGPADLAGLSLAAGTAVADAIQDIGLSDVALKWPNDILWQERKLAGLLLEAAGEAHGHAYVVVGLGLNLCIGAEGAGKIDQPWADLDTACGGRRPERNRLAARLIAALTAALDDFEQHGLAPFLPLWQTFDRYQGRPITLIVGERTIEGIHRGITDTGALRVLTASGERTFHAGEVTMRSTEPLCHR